MSTLASLSIEVPGFHSATSILVKPNLEPRRFSVRCRSLLRSVKILLIDGIWTELCIIIIFCPNSSESEQSVSVYKDTYVLF
jgi:hypothetical protein